MTDTPERKLARPLRVIFDLDGTLSNSEHRVKYLTGDVKDWRAFYAACDLDEPVVPIVATMKAMLASGHDCEIWSGRSMEVAEETVHWLDRNGLGGVVVRMRPAGDHQADTTLKAGWLEATESKPDLVFEDRASVVDMWRSHGIVCCQVAPGNF